MTPMPGVTTTPGEADAAPPAHAPARQATILGRPAAAATATSPDALAEAILVDDRYDQHVRWEPGERLHHVFEAMVDGLDAAGRSDTVAVSLPTQEITYAELDRRANALARYLRERGIGPGQRVGLLFDAAVPSYVALLATLKAGAAYVPLDPGFPPERIAFIAGNAQLSTVLSESHLHDRFHALDEDRPPTYLDEAAERISQLPGDRLETGRPDAAAVDGADRPDDELCYVIYTSGSTGMPKGVPINHSSICNFVRVAAEVYGLRASDRMYQGMTIAFDFSVEEIWLAWAVGATLVPKTTRGALVGSDLRDELVGRRITAMSCVPTLLATIEEDVPHLRFLLVSGEACPQDLIARWWRPDRRFLNVYGPTETTVTATWTTLHPCEPVTIGVPLPTYAALILETGDTTALPRGEIGEVALAGIALSPGYLDRPEQTAKAFVPDTLGVPNNPSGMLYRTGDLGRITAQGRIEYLGRIDTQVKIRGYRIELTEIESVLLQAPGVAAAVVEPYRPEPDVVELVAYLVRRHDCAELDRGVVVSSLRERLPTYMVPAFVEELDALPLLPSDKVDRKRLPAPTSPRHTVGPGNIVPPETELEEILTTELAATLGIRAVGVTAHIFDDLGATSIRMSAYCTRLRAHPGLESVRISDIYLNPTVRALAGALAQIDEDAGLDADAASEPDAQSARLAAAALAAGIGAPRRYPRVGALRWTLCGLYQLLVMLAYPAALTVVSVPIMHWVVDAPSYQATYLRSMAFGTALFAVTIVVPVIAKWVLIGRWRAREFPAWGLTYLRFWTVRLLLAINPMRLFAGSPLLAWYLRALGATVGPRTLILSTSLPLTTDLLTIGADTVICRRTVLPGYRIDSGWVRTGPVRIGSDAYVGDGSVLDIYTRMGDGAQLGHASALLPGQSMPGSARWHGVPGRPTPTQFRRGPAVRCRRIRRIAYPLGQLLVLLLGPAPLIFAALVSALEHATPGVIPALLGVSEVPWQVAMVELLAAVTTVTFGVGLLLSLTIAWTVPRLLGLAIRPGVAYPLYGVRYVLSRWIGRLSNVTGHLKLFGDSSYIVGYLSRLGYRLKPVVQTGSNFGLQVSHDIPTMCAVGPGTIASDGLFFENIDFSSTGFVASPVRVGARNFVGNNVHMPTGARLGDDLLLATKVAVPLDGPVRQGVGLLGSPAFEIPLGRGPDRYAVRPIGVADPGRGVPRKNRFNRTSMAFLLFNQLLVTMVVVVATQAAYELSYRHGLWVAAVIMAPLPLALLWWSVLVERASIGFGRLQARRSTLYHHFFWRHERYWKFSVGPGIAMLDGTPFKAWYLRALGLEVGRRLLDDGCQIVERTVVRIGDDVTLNTQSVLQCHSLEHGTFTCTPLRVQSRATVGVRAFVHYGTCLGAGATLETDSFLMKGEQVPAGQRWRGNPAGPVSAGRA